MLRTFIAALLSSLLYRIARYILEILMPPTPIQPHAVSCVCYDGTMNASLANVRLQVWPTSGCRFGQRQAIWTSYGSLASRHPATEWRAQKLFAFLFIFAILSFEHEVAQCDERCTRSLEIISQEQVVQA